MPALFDSDFFQLLARYSEAGRYYHTVEHLGHWGTASACSTRYSRARTAGRITKCGVYASLDRYKKGQPTT